MLGDRCCVLLARDSERHNCLVAGGKLFRAVEMRAFKIAYGKLVVSLGKQYKGVLVVDFIVPVKNVIIVFYSKNPFLNKN